MACLVAVGRSTCRTTLLLLSLWVASAVGFLFEEPDIFTPRGAGANGEAEDVRELPDDALQVLPSPPLLQNKTSFVCPHAVQPPLVPPLVRTGLPRCRQLAKAWQLCPAWAKDVPHTTDSVASLKGKFLYIDNVKAGSSSLRQLIEEVVSVNWRHTDVPHNDKHPACSSRTSTGSFAMESLAPLFIFSFVRDPVKKFESGVRQTWFQNPHLAHMTADELLDMQLRRSDQLSRPAKNNVCTQNWVNEHLQPSSWRLGAQGIDGKVVHVDCIGQIETFDEDWEAVLGSMANISRGDLKRLTAIGHANPHPRVPRSKLSPQGIRKMCQSWVYEHEWDCFGYPRPAECH